EGGSADDWQQLQRSYDRWLFVAEIKKRLLDGAAKAAVAAEGRELGRRRDLEEAGDSSGGSRVFLLDSYGIAAPEVVRLLKSDPDLARLLGPQGQRISHIASGFAGPEGWKLTGLPVTAAAADGRGDGNQAAEPAAAAFP
ncbi:hypothetical protein Agub_g3869, partial [Astrephomene gubernaculifera]